MNNFITHIIDSESKSNICTRFPPEPNGYLHLGHAKSIFLNFGIAAQYNGKCNLRLDDTNPSKENKEYIESIISDVKWLVGEPAYISYASSNFNMCYIKAIELIKKNLAYVCDMTHGELALSRTKTTEWAASPYRNRTIEENLKLFNDMKLGIKTNSVLRAKIDMAHPNLNMRDPVLYRYLNMAHPITGTEWCIYPMYDYAHPICDMMENITYSICTLEFEDHRPLYDWVVNNCNCGTYPRQIEFARLNVQNIVLSKRLLLEVVEKHGISWSDPRMPTIQGLRNRGYTREMLRDFCDFIGVSKANTTIESNVLENAARNILNKEADRIMAIENPVTVIITNLEKDEIVEVPLNPEDPNTAIRKVPFSREILIDKADFMLNPPKKYYRLSPNNEVRLKGACIIKYVSHEETPNGLVIYCTCDMNKDKKVKSTIGWISKNNAIDVKINKFYNMFNDNEYNPNSKSTSLIKIEAHNFIPGKHYQFYRNGYYYYTENFEFNHVVSLKDSFKLGI